MQVSMKRPKMDTIDDENLNLENNLLNFYHENLDDTSYDTQMIKDLFESKRIHISSKGERETVIRGSNRLENDSSNEGIRTESDSDGDDDDAYRDTYATQGQKNKKNSNNQRRVGIHQKADEENK